MKPNMKWTLLAITIPSLIACGGGSDSNTADSHKAPVSVVSGYETAKVGNRIRVDGLGSYGVRRQYRNVHLVYQQKTTRQ